jgi:hypothetical protein
VHSTVSRARIVDAQFFMLGWNWYGSHKKCTEAHYAKLVFLHPLGSTGHEMHSGVSGC